MIRCTVLFILLSASVVFAQPPRAQLRRGVRHYVEERYEEAIRDFSEAGRKAETERLDPAIAVFNKANAHYRKGDHEQALALYEEALRSDNLELNTSAWFNRGNALTALSGRLEQEGQFEPAMRLLEEALRSYENTLTLNPADHDAKINHELVSLWKQELEQQLLEQPPPPPQPEPDPSPEEDDPEQPDDPDRPEPDEDEEPDPPTDRPEDRPAPAEEETVEPEWDEPEDLSLEEAMMLLDALQEEEDVQREQMRRQPRRTEVEKDW